MSVHLSGIDHFVLTVMDIERSCRFYERLGAQVVTFGNGRKAVHFGSQKINLHPRTDNDVEPVARNPVTGGGDFCLISEDPIEEVTMHLQEEGIDIIAGPMQRTGAVGTLESVYFRDPDGNLVEIAEYIED